ncbi:cupin domain-containing protein [Pantoea ananatis]|uniref:cupin domain-containing protein n=1 Tax=Pantoea ananas TaxID=553 RepID=UPI000CF56631|nr:hypothetical protein [Pantoea ananatis]PQK71581.1 hypothetical protein CG427_17225 [Pantoea ananatis]
MKNDYKTSFNAFELNHGLLANMENDEFPTNLWCVSKSRLELPGNATHFGYVYEGTLSLENESGSFILKEGMYFSSPGKTTLYGDGRGIAVSRVDYFGFFNIGGPVEKQGRLKYIDGCTDSLLISPVTMGDSCLNLLYFPSGVNQTQHTHPSLRAGIVIRGQGECITPEGSTPLIPGLVFIIPAEAIHGFHTYGSDMSIIAFHPDSDFGPTDESHPMINRTIVDGVPANAIESIRTK